LSFSSFKDAGPYFVSSHLNRQEESEDVIFGSLSGETSKMHSRLRHLVLLPALNRNAFAFVLLLVLLGSRPAFCDPIHDAAKKGDLAKVKALIKDSPNLVSVKDKMGNTPLHLAASNDHAEVMEFLLASGADVNARNGNGGNSPMDFALGCINHKDTLALLIAHGANVNARADNGITALHEVAMRGVMEDAVLLIAHGADADARDMKGNTPLHWALLMGHTNVAELLIAKMTDVNIRDNFGHTPMFLAKIRSNSKIEELLHQKGGHE
jgi:cytohesin